MRHISDGHEIRPRGGLLLVTTLHFYLHRYFPVAIDRSIREHSFLENLHMGNQGVSDLLRRPASGPFAWLKSLLGDGGHPWQAGAALLPSISAASQPYAIWHASGQPLWPGAPRHHPHSTLFLFTTTELSLPLRSLSKALGTERLPRTRIAATTGLLVILGFCPHLDASPGARAWIRRRKRAECGTERANERVQARFGASRFLGGRQGGCK